MDREIAIPQPKRIMLPLLVMLFLISYGLLALLVVEQGRTIDSQRDLIRDMFSDTAQLSAMKRTLLRKQNEANGRSQVHGQAPSSQLHVPSFKNPLTQNPAQSNQAQLNQNPSTQVMQQGNAKSGNANKLRKVVPQKPPTAASDAPDSRRNVFHI